VVGVNATGVPDEWPANRVVGRSVGAMEGAQGQSSAGRRGRVQREWQRTVRENKKALCGNRRPSNDCLPYEKS
jgi:hypothetical protein